MKNNIGYHEHLRVVEHITRTLERAYRRIERLEQFIEWDVPMFIADKLREDFEEHKEIMFKVLEKDNE
jgi:hypothetical protein